MCTIKKGQKVICIKKHNNWQELDLENCISTPSSVDVEYGKEYVINETFCMTEEQMMNGGLPSIYCFSLVGKGDTVFTERNFVDKEDFIND